MDSHYKTALKFCLVSLMKENTGFQHTLEFFTGDEITSYSSLNKREPMSGATHGLHTVL